MQPAQTYIEDQQLYLPITENGVRKLGDLFNCRTSKGVGFSLFGKNLQKEHVSSSPISDTSYTLTHIQNSSDKMKSLEVSGNMSLEIMAGLIKVEGSAAYDSSDTNSSHTETLSCDYRLDGFQVDLLPSARAAIDPDVKRMIMDNEICATHIVKGVIIGGKLNAKISISKKDAKQKQGIKGSCLGKLVYGPINASIKADLEMLDSDESGCFNKQITIHSKPSIIDPQPISIADMFRAIGNFSSAINQETHYTDWEAKIRGVPIKFILVPIIQFLNHDVEKIYAQLKDDIFQRFKNLLINARDYSSSEYVGRQIINRREDISILLMNDQSALSMEVSTYAEELRCKANNVYQKAVSLLNRHRCGKVKPEDMLQMLIDAEKSVNPFEVVKKIENFIETAQKELTGMHHGDLGKSNSIKVFTDKANLTEWFASESGCKISLQTKGQPQEVFHKFDVLSQKLGEFGFEVAVSVPSASQNFSLSIKLFEHAKEYRSDINYILAILKCVVSHGAGVEYEFFNLYSNIFRISLPMEPNEIRQVNHLIGNLSGCQNIYMANSRLDILDRLANSRTELSFFIPIEAFETSFDAVSNLTGLHTKYSNVDWTVGPFLTNHLVAPMLLIFKGMSLMATCFDNIDLLFLDHIWSSKKKSDGSFDFSILSTENYQHTFHGDRLEYVSELLTTLNDTNTLGQLSEAQFWKSLNLTVNEYASDVILLLQATAFHDQILFKQRLADVVLRKVPYLPIHDVKNVISRNKDIPQLISTLEAWCKQRSPNMALAYEIDDLMKYYKSSEESKLSSAVVILIEHVDFEQSIREIYDNWKNSHHTFLFSKINEAIQNHIRVQANNDDQMWYVRKLIKSLTDCNATVQQDIMVSLCQRIGLADDELKLIQDLIRDRLYRNAVSAISKHKYGSNMNIFEAHMGKMNEIENYQLLFDSVVKSGFIQSAELWRNAKFLYLVQENLQSESFLRSIVTFYNSGIPEYIPPEIRTVLNNMSQEDKDFEFPSSIKSRQDFEHFLNRILRLRERKSVPTEFRCFLTTTIAGNEPLRTELQKLDALPHWNISENRFNELWTFEHIQQVLTKLSNQEDESQTDAVNTGESIINLDVDINVPTDLPIQRNNNVIYVRDQFNVIFGDTLSTINNADFVKITKLISKPSFNYRNIRGYGSILLPYLLQQIKMCGCDNLLEENLNQMVDVESIISDESEQSADDPANIFNDFDAGNDQECFESSKNHVPISRLDCLTGLFNITDITVAQDIVRNISQFSMSLPLVIQNVDKNDEAKFKFLLPFFIGLKIKWEQQHGSIAENFLFKSPFQLILAVRIGEPTQSGKSSILNQVLVCRKTKNMFASKSSPGNEFGPALSLPGSVEFIWLTEETADNTLWETLRPHYCGGEDRPIVLLANLHGNVFDYSDTVKLLGSFTTACIVFVMPTELSTGATMKADCDRFTEIVGNINVKKTIAIVDPFNNSDNDNTIRTNQLTNENTLKKVRKLIKSSLTSTAITYDTATTVLRSPTFSAMESIGTSESSKVIGIVKREGPLEIRRALQLQRGLKSAKAGKSKWEQCELLQETIRSFCNILLLPRNQRMKALLHLESEMFAMSNEKSKTLRNYILKQNNELRKIVFIEEQSTQVQKLKKSIKSNQNTLNDITLGLEHFYRELAQIHFINLSLRTQIQADSFIFIAPEKYAELLIDGHAIEILDGDACKLHELWLMKIFHHVSIMKPNLKIFVVTILGLQSSGKSTLLNALFACRFAVSVGRCTRGLFARLLFLDNEMKNEFNIVADAILLIDTEGLGAPEMMNNPDNAKKDRKLATFAMGISDLTIINMLGEYMTDLTDILQIAIIAMARLEITGMSPDIMVVQHHLTERNADMVTTAIDSFNTALIDAITLTEQSEIGIRGAKCLKRMFGRFQSGEILKSFSPYKDGATANSPPSKQYQNDVVHLYKSILRVCQESGQIVEFEKWYKLLRDFWSSVATEDFAVNFKNLKEVYEFIALGKLIATFKEAVDLVFRHHGESIESYLNVKISSDPTPLINRDNNLRDVKRFVHMMPDMCMNEALQKNAKRCGKCLRMVKDENKLRDYVKSKKNKNEILNTIHEYKRDMKSSKLTYLTQRYDAMVISNKSCDLFERRVDEVLKLKLDNRTITYNEDEITEIENEIWKSLERIASGRQIIDMVENTIRNEVLKIYEKVNCDIVRGYDGYVGEEPWYDMKAIYVRLFANKNLDEAQKRWLRDQARTLPFAMVENFPIHNFDTAMVKTLVRRISEAIENDILNEFERTYRVKLVGEFTTQYTAHALKQFKLHMVGLEKIWKKSNDPMEILIMKKDYYVTMIGTRLRHGFNYYGDGRIASELVLAAISEKSIKFANDARVNYFLGVDWFTCCESIRLKHFRKLIDDIKHGNTLTGAQYFEDPQHHFEKWFKSEVDTCANDAVARLEFLETFQREHDSFVQSIRNNAEKADIIFSTIKQLLMTSGKEYKTSTTFQNDLSNNLTSFTSGLLDGLKNVTSKDSFESIQLPRLSDDATILKRVGCTKSCKYCGAMCMGAHGHDKDTGNTKMHHTLHQPQGLAGIRYRDSQVLVEGSCNSEIDSNIWYTGDVQTTWGAIKEKDWLYGQSCKVEFRDLMIWFFKELQHKIASGRNAVPITAEKIEELGWNDIASIDELVAEIESAISVA